MLRDYQVISIRHLTEDCFVLRTERKDLKFDAGQLVSLGPRGMGVNREYSIYSGEQAQHLEFLVRNITDGTVSKRLSRLETGDKVFILGPYSEFKIKHTVKSHRPHWLIATGTGIAPFHSIVQSYPQLNYRMIHGIRLASEKYDAQDYAPDSYLPCISKDRQGDRVAFSGRVTHYLSEAPLPPKGVYYLCGNNHMITEAYKILISRGVSSDDIHSEVFF